MLCVIGSAVQYKGVCFSVQASALPDSNESEMQRRRWLAELATYWNHLMRAVAYTCVEPLTSVRDHALVVMHRCMDVAGHSLKLPHETWGSTWRDIILPMLADLAGRMQARPLHHHSACTCMCSVCISKGYPHGVVRPPDETACMLQFSTGRSRSIWIT